MCYLHGHKQLPVHGVARHPLCSELASDCPDRIRTSHRSAGVAGRPAQVFRPDLGEVVVLRGRIGQVLLRHGRLRQRARGVRRGSGGRAAGHAGRVHDAGGCGEGLLRREQRGRLQPAGVDRPAGSGGGRVQLDGVPRGREREVPGGAAAEEVGRGRGGVQERVPCVQHRPVLLPGSLRRRPAGVPSDRLLKALQGCVPASLQLRLRRFQQHLHLHWS